MSAVRTIRMEVSPVSADMLKHVSLRQNSRGCDHRGEYNLPFQSSLHGEKQNSRIQAAFHCPRTAAPEFPAVLLRTAHLADRHLDADRGAVLAGIPADRLAGAAGVGQLRRPNSGVSAFDDRRRGGGPL